MASLFTLNATASRDGLEAKRLCDELWSWLLEYGPYQCRVLIEVPAIVFGGWVGFEGNGGWEKVPGLLVWDAIALRLSNQAESLTNPVELLMSVVPLVGLLVWDAIALRLSNQAESLTDPVELLMSVVPLVGLLVWDAIALRLSNQAESLTDPVELLMSEGDNAIWNSPPAMAWSMHIVEETDNKKM
ncbi:tryptophan/tyrosine permease [Artemisia annua]|uniref:Tryptophan/tyrosine permease n=1 Tax=Artemisia annua TaxID=35608 RepID=A0A2U1KV06_ARTAN|nr:tryptophan/tyrosine permease [Artemisia annua]